jgi:hypothetical protein
MDLYHIDTDSLTVRKFFWVPQVGFCRSNEIHLRLGPTVPGRVFHIFRRLWSPVGYSCPHEVPRQKGQACQSDLYLRVRVFDICDRYVDCSDTE